jgi:D-alanyl-D-alanine carboxypeptidase (penicillin-binding protein 5/6)
MNIETGEILYENNAYERRYPASVTKMATALYALDCYKLNLSEIVKVECHLLQKATMLQKKKSPLRYPSYLLEPDGISMNLKPLEKISLQTLFYGLMLTSGCDAANVIANHCCKNIPIFLNEMNQFLKSIGCKDTHFTNPHGLHDENHYTTAFDCAIVAQKTMQNSVLAEIVKAITYQREDTNKQKNNEIVQINKMLKPGPFYYSKAVGIKIGYTSFSGFNLVAAAVNDEQKLIAVILGSTNPENCYQDARNLFEAAFNKTRDK